jgi:CDP-diacylglycerol---serine O-phosphatidyltransferase
LPLYATLAGMPSFPGLPVVVLLYTLLMAFFTVCTIPTISSKMISMTVDRRYVLPLFAGAVALVALLFMHTFETLAGLIIVYLALIPVGVARYRSTQKAWLALTADKADESKPAVE